MLNEYQGLIHTGAFKKNPDLCKFIEPFKAHYRYGHHPEFGKDTLFGRPPEVWPYHLRKVHVDLKFYTNQFGDSGTEACWKNWATGKLDKTTKKFKVIPTSDVYLIYLVSSERHCFLIDFWGPPSSAHREAEEEKQMDKLIQECDRILRLKGLQSMPREAEIWRPEFLV